MAWAQWSKNQCFCSRPVYCVSRKIRPKCSYELRTDCRIKEWSFIDTPRSWVLRYADCNLPRTALSRRRIRSGKADMVDASITRCSDNPLVAYLGDCRSYTNAIGAGLAGRARDGLVLEDTGDRDADGVALRSCYSADGHRVTMPIPQPGELHARRRGRTIERLAAVFTIGTLLHCHSRATRGGIPCPIRDAARNWRRSYGEGGSRRRCTARRSNAAIVGHRRTESNGRSVRRSALHNRSRTGNSWRLFVNNSNVGITGGRQLICVGYRQSNGGCAQDIRPGRRLLERNGFTIRIGRAVVN